MNKWLIGARPRTLPAAIAPVLTATALAYHLNGKIDLLNAFLALLVGVLLQVGVNYSNDYSDGIKGTDFERIGPMRLVGSGAATADARATRPANPAANALSARALACRAHGFAR